ncbi:MAG: discoidin domain-containing protein, partial [Chitinophagia bacterium]|nr:discoidin domain-containing protein [Chitinophagia bacterium]
MLFNLKAWGMLFIVYLFQIAFCFGQVPISVGSGSYASFPPASETADDWNNNGVGDLQQFLYTNPIYVAPNRINSPIPTNDWWTDLIVSGKNCGMLWAYPLSVDPDPTGLKMYFANSFVADGSNLNYGGYMHIGASNYAPTKGFAKDWSDWGLVMSLKDSINNKNMDVTMAHGVPYMWLQTQGMNPEFSFDKSASYLDASGNAISFPTSNSFVVQTDGRYFGIHLPGNTTAEIQGQQFVKIDLGSVQNLSKLKILWETAYAKSYSLSVSNDSINYTPVYSTTSGDGGYDSATLNASGRYIKLSLIERGTIYAYSIYE